MTTPDLLACPGCGRGTDYRVYADGRVVCADDECRAVVARLLPSTVAAWRRRCFVERAAGQLADRPPGGLADGG